MKSTRDRILSAERRRIGTSPAGRVRVGVGYPNTYRVAMSSLAFQWMIEITASCPGVGVERFFSDQAIDGRTLDGDTPLGNLDVLAWSCSFELDETNILRSLDRAGIPRRRTDRGRHHPLIVMGGAVASINPLPMSPAVDVFVLGSGELLWPPLLDLLQSTANRQRLLEELAERDGYFVPALHLGDRGDPATRCRRVEKRNRHMNDRAMVPVSHVVTPHTEYRGRGLIEMSRGCPEKCRYCWVSYNHGRLRCYRADHILERVDQLARITDRVGFVATAVGDHPRLPEILEACRSRGLDVALSSLRIPAMRDEVLGPLAATGTRSITIAPETGSDRLRRRLNKPITNREILTAVEAAQRRGIGNIKMYFVIGLPDETDDDLRAIGELLQSAREVMLESGRARGKMGTIHAGVSILVPKPYTPYSRLPMLTRHEARRRLRIVDLAIAGVPNLRWDRPSYREAQWQGFLARADGRAFPAIEEAASGVPISRIVAKLGPMLDETTHRAVEGSPVWQFISSAPVRQPA